MFTKDSFCTIFKLGDSMKFIFLILSLFVVTNVYAEGINNYIEDSNFKECIIEEYNNNYHTDKQDLSLDELKEIRSLKCSNKEINNIKGIEHLTSLVELDLSNNNISEFDISHNLELNSLNLGNNILEKVDLKNNINLQKLNLSNNNIKEIYLDNNLLLEELNLSNNRLQSLDIKSNLNLTKLSIKNNDFQKILNKKTERFSSTIQYNPYFLSKQEDITYNSSDTSSVQIDENGELNFLLIKPVTITKTYYLYTDEGTEQVQESNIFNLDNKVSETVPKNNFRNLPYIIVLIIVLFILIYTKHFNFNKKNK